MSHVSGIIFQQAHFHALWQAPSGIITMSGKGRFRCFDFRRLRFLKVRLGADLLRLDRLRLTRLQVPFAGFRRAGWFATRFTRGGNHCSPFLNCSQPVRRGAWRGCGSPSAQGPRSGSNRRSLSMAISPPHEGLQPCCADSRFPMPRSFKA
jgi:hypothetical protein